MSDDIETALTFNSIGTTVITNTKHKTFQVRMSSDAKEWINNPDNRQWLHDKLNAFLDAYK